MEDKLEEIQLTDKGGEERNERYPDEDEEPHDPPVHEDGEIGDEMVTYYDPGDQRSSSPSPSHHPFLPSRPTLSRYPSYSHHPRFFAGSARKRQGRGRQQNRRGYHARRLQMIPLYSPPQNRGEGAQHAVLFFVQNAHKYYNAVRAYSANEPFYCQVQCSGGKLQFNCSSNLPQIWQYPQHDRNRIFMGSTKKKFYVDIFTNVPWIEVNRIPIFAQLSKVFCIQFIQESATEKALFVSPFSIEKENTWFPVAKLEFSFVMDRLTFKIHHHILVILKMSEFFRA